MENNSKGSGFLKVTGILMIIGGSLGLILGIIAIAGVGLLAAVSDGAISSTLLTVSCLFIIVSAVAELVAGIIGIKNCKAPEKATSCIVWGIIVAVLCIAGEIFSVASGSSFNVLSVILGLVLPVLYIIGAALNKKSA